MNSKLEIIKLSLLAIIALCLVIIVIQGFGGGTQDVYVRGGDVDAYVRGSVEVDNTVSVSIDEVLGRDGKKYYYNNY